MSQPFDMQKAREIDESLYDEPDQDVGGNPCPIRKEIISMFPAALDEIERLQAVIDQAAAAWLALNPGIAWEGGLDGAMAAAVSEIERLIHSVDEVVVQLSACRSVAKAIQNEQAARIRELEGAYRLFVESNTKIKIFEKKQTDGILAALDMYEELEKKNIKQHAALKKLGEKVRARGKAMMLTKEQRAALEIVLALFDPTAFNDQDRLEASLRAKQVLHSLSTDASPAWEVTEERKVALDVAIRDLGKIGKSLECHTAGVLRDMLEEARP